MLAAAGRYAAGQVDVFRLKTGPRSVWPNFRYDTWLNMDGTSLTHALPVLVGSPEQIINFAA
jgi:hypothetical protein